MWKIIIGGSLAAAGIGWIVSQTLPDVKRYMKMRAM